MSVPLTYNQILKKRLRHGNLGEISALEVNFYLHKARGNMMGEEDYGQALSVIEPIAQTRETEWRERGARYAGDFGDWGW